MDELEFRRVRDDVLQAMYWMHAEGLADAPAAVELVRFLAIEPATLTPVLERMVGDGDLERDGERHRLSERGRGEAKRSFADEFADMTRPGHGECDEDCWCHDSPEEAARCLEDRAGHVHG